MADTTLRDHTAALGETSLTADVAIVGSGPGGAAAARVLAGSGLRVVVLEEGPARPIFRRNAAHTNRYHMQEGGAMVASGSTFMPIAAGRGVGGGSLVNSAMCWRTPDAVLDGWSGLLDGDRRYGPRALAPIFDEIEARIQVGPTPEPIAGENNLLIVRGARALGLEGGLIRRNTPGCVGCAHCNNGCPVGGKESVDRNLLADARADGAIVQADTKVDSVLHDGTRTTGVAGDVIDTHSRAVVGRLTVHADRVLVCAGGIGTPRLLHHAGLAARLGPAVGRGLHIHPGSAVVGRCPHEVRMWTGATQAAYFHDPQISGFLPHTFNAPPGVLVLILAKGGIPAKEALQLLPYLAGCIVMISDKGEGRVGAHADGRADIQYWFDDDDMDRIKRGMVRTAEVLLAGGAEALHCPVHGVGRHTTVSSFAGALSSRTIADFQMYASHPMASCRMGADPSRSVVGPTGEAHGLKGLFIADSSVFPTSLGVNPQLTTMVMATAIARNLVPS